MSRVSFAPFAPSRFNSFDLFYRKDDLMEMAEMRGAIRERARGMREEYLRDLKRIVDMDSPTDDKAGVDAVGRIGRAQGMGEARRVASWMAIFEAAGADVSAIPLMRSHRARRPSARDMAGHGRQPGRRTRRTH